MPKSPKEIFSSFSDMELLQHMAETKNIEVGDKSRKKLITELTEHVSSQGLYVLLYYLKQDILKKLSQYCHWGKRDKTPTNKATLAKKIQDAMEDDSPSKFLMHCTSKLLKEMLEYLEMDVPDSKDKCVEAILSLADEMGLERFFSSFPVSKLKEFVTSCSLKIDSESMDTLLASLMEQESIKAPFKSDEAPSKNKPDIDKKITATDLHHHYFREDLAIWLKENNPKLNSNGSKKELVDRIRRYFDDKLLDRDTLGPKKKKSTDRELTEEKGEEDRKNKKPRDESPDEKDKEKSDKRKSSSVLYKDE